VVQVDLSRLPLSVVVVVVLVLRLIVFFPLQAPSRRPARNPGSRRLVLFFYFYLFIYFFFFVGSCHRILPSLACSAQVTIGSGLLQSSLFDFYVSNTNKCAFCYGVQITRLPQPGLFTCHSGKVAFSLLFFFLFFFVCGSPFAQQICSFFFLSL
jgi:hypothetical protein